MDPETAPLVVEIFERYSEGATVRSIIEDFNSRGLTTKRGKPFNTNSFNALLKNRKYIGEYSYQDVVIPGGVPFIFGPGCCSGLLCGICHKGISVFGTSVPPCDYVIALSLALVKSEC